MLLRESNNETYNNNENVSNKLPPDKLIIVDETPPPSTASSSSSSSSSTSSLPSIATSSNNQCPSISLSQPINVHCEDTINQACLRPASASPSTSLKKKSVLFDNVTVYHFNRSQGFTSIPSQGGSTLGMKRKHFLRRRLSVDLYEEVRRRSRRDILLKIKFEKRKQEEQLRLERQRQFNERLKIEGSSTSSTVSNTNTSDSDDNEQASNSQEADDDDESYSEFSDISDSELESDSYIFLQPICVKVRRSLLRASGVGRIDPKERLECKRIRDSRANSGCRCVGQCIPEYCECSRLGVRCHVDRISFPCGCNSEGCRNPEGRSEFDKSGVRRHFEDRVVKSDSFHSDSSNDIIDPEQLEPITGTIAEEIC